MHKTKLLADAPRGSLISVVKGWPGTRSRVNCARLRRRGRLFWLSVIKAALNSRVTQIPTREMSPSGKKVNETAASRFACCAGPICWIGYQYWLQDLVSPGCKKLKSGWLSV